MDSNFLLLMDNCWGDIKYFCVNCFFSICSPENKNEAAEEIEETPQEKKLRLAKLYLEQLRQQGEEKLDLI